MNAFLKTYLPLIAFIMMFGSIIAEWFGVPFQVTAPVAILGFVIYSPYYWRSIR